MKLSPTKNIYGIKCTLQPFRIQNNDDLMLGPLKGNYASLRMGKVDGTVSSHYYT